jgi:hypothetical protein
MKILSLALLALGLPLIAVSAQENSRPPQISVSGTADVMVTPDEAVIHVGVETRNESLEQARHQHDDSMKKALTFLKTTGIPDKNVQTDYINISTEYRNESSRSQTTIYVVRKFIEVRLTNVMQLEKTLTGLLDSGVDRVNYVEFKTTQLRKYRDQARSMAIQAAKEKADVLCADLGIKRGKPLNINASESGGSFNPYYGSYWYGRGGSLANNAQVAVEDSDHPSDSISGTLSLGQISVSATVNVSFALED